ncbi:uncharacterized protein LOC122941497 isoform X2 [Bufo gargarizans]|uniref:uncharacterized protein LOC122941497 isoform X2 n=1 Tax=Bufo gargarizans TaxID=30331 RepID=UPI001CF0EBC6|nr:uncharacterized protein LOC122941497 isoform X2 [Bufo gargarizans]
MERRDTDPPPMESEESNQNQPDNNNNLNAEEKLRKRKKCRQIDEKTIRKIVKSGNAFIVTFNKLLKKTEACKAQHYMERVLHSIFFFGHIHDPPISPDKFLPGRLTEGFRSQFPKPFSEYKTHLPSYTPYSILLEYMVEHLNPEDPDEFMNQLAANNESLWKISDGVGNKPTVNEFALLATVISYCCVKESNTAKVLKKAYGASVSCKGMPQREIMIALSALHVWDKAISYAVSCEGNSPPITFPEKVQCSAYKYKPKRGSYKKIPPCTKCNKMYDVEYDPEHQEHDDEEPWPYGNCAENESINKLLQMDKDIRNNICIVGKNREILMNREEIENKFKEEYEDEKKRKVRKLLKSRRFKLKSEEWKFFTPSHSL